MYKASNKSFYIHIISAVLLTFAGTYNLLFLIPALVIVPAILAKIYYKYSCWEYIYTVLSIAVFNTISNFALNNEIIFPACVSIMIAISAYIISYGLKKHHAASRIIFTLVAADIIMLLCALAYVRFGLSINITSAMRGFLSQIYNNFTKVIKVYSPESSAAFEDNQFETFNIFYNVIPGIVPTVLIIAAAVISLLKYTVSKLITRHVMIEGSNFSDGIDKIRASAVVNIVAIISFVISNSETDFFTMIALNVFYITVGFYILTALSVLEYKLKTKIPSQLKRLLIFSLVIGTSVFATLSMPAINVFLFAAVIGFTDSIFDYRKLKTNNEDEENEEE